MKDFKDECCDFVHHTGRYAEWPKDSYYGFQCNGMYVNSKDPLNEAVFQRMIECDLRLRIQEITETEYDNTFIMINGDIVDGSEFLKRYTPDSVHGYLIDGMTESEIIEKQIGMSVSEYNEVISKVDQMMSEDFADDFDEETNVDYIERCAAMAANATNITTQSSESDKNDELPY